MEKKLILISKFDLVEDIMEKKLILISKFDLVEDIAALIG